MPVTIRQAVETYLASARVGELDPVAWRVYASLVLYGATEGGLEGTFVLPFRRRSVDDPTTLQDLTISAASGRKLSHGTISAATSRLLAAGLVYRGRKETKDGRTDGPGTPYWWGLFKADDQISYAWQSAPEAIAAVIEPRIATPRQAYLLARLCEFADDN